MSIIPLPRSDGPAVGQAAADHTAPSDELHDALLARRLSSGDTAALDELIDRFWSPLASYASRILDDMTAAEDVALEVFVRMWERRAECPRRSVAAYLFRTTRNLALDTLRSRNARWDRERKREREVRRHPRTPADVLRDEELAAALDSAIQALPERRREAFTLAYLENRSYSEVAEIMSLSSKTVGNHISAALTELRETLGPLLSQAPDTTA